MINVNNIQKGIEYDITDASKIKKTVRNEGVSRKVEIYEDTRVLNIKISKK